MPQEARKNCNRHNLLFTIIRNNCLERRQEKKKKEKKSERRNGKETTVTVRELRLLRMETGSAMSRFAIVSCTEMHSGIHVYTCIQGSQSVLSRSVQ